MKSVRVTNSTLAEIVIEDLGIRIPAKASAVVRPDLADWSTSLKELVRLHRVLVSVETSETPMPMWPFSKPPAQTKPQPPSPAQRVVTPSDSVPAVQIPSPQMPTSPDIVEKFDRIIELLQASLMIGSSSLPTNPMGRAETTQSTHSDGGSAQIPVILSRPIIPQNAEVRIQPLSQETGSTSVEASVEALRKARRRRSTP